MFFSRDKKRAILFADVAGSSALYKAEGDVKAKGLIDQIIWEMKKQTELCSGKVIKTIGDEVMACFDHCDDACRAAMAIQNASESFSGHSTIAVRIGIGYGKTLKDADDLFGESVNDAAFVTQIAKGSQIVLTESVYQHLSTELKSYAREFDKVTIKGSRDRSTIYRLFWKTPSAGFSETQVISVHSVNQHLDSEQLKLILDLCRFL